MEQKFSTFGLTIEQTEILFSLQRLITNSDWLYTQNSRSAFFPKKDTAHKKRLWLSKWDDHINNYLKELGGKEYLLTSPVAIKKAIQQIDSTTDNNIWKYMILLECVLYTPYYPLSMDKDEFKQFKGLKLEKENRTEQLHQICSLLSINTTYIKIFENAYSKSIKSLSGYWTKVAMSAGFGMIVILIAILTFQYEIIAFFAANGLAGAAAISSGLAALGGGAIAAGGYGMIGGIAVLIGGGSLLGISAGTAAGLSIASLGANAILSEAAKMQVVLTEIVLAIQKDTKYFQQILLNLQQQVCELKQNLTVLKEQAQKDEKRIKNLEKSIKYLEKLIKNNK